MFSEIDWNNDLSYEVIGVVTSKSSKNIDNIGGIFVVMQYNEKIGKWQVSGTIGGVM